MNINRHISPSVPTSSSALSLLMDVITAASDDQAMTAMSDILGRSRGKGLLEMGTRPLIFPVLERIEAV